MFLRRIRLTTYQAKKLKQAAIVIDIKLTRKLIFEDAGIGKSNTEVVFIYVRCRKQPINYYKSNYLVYKSFNRDGCFSDLKVVLNKCNTEKSQITKPKLRDGANITMRCRCATFYSNRELTYTHTRLQSKVNK